MCVRLSFLLKYLSFIAATAHVVSKRTERMGGGGSHVSSCCSLGPARPACVSHTLPPDAEEGVCVCEVRRSSIHPEQLSLSDLETHSRS